VDAKSRSGVAHKALPGARGRQTACVVIDCAESETRDAD